MKQRTFWKIGLGFYSALTGIAIISLITTTSIVASMFLSIGIFCGAGMIIYYLNKLIQD